MRRWHTAGIVAVSTSLLAALALAAPRASAERFGYDDLSAVQKRHASGILADTLGAPAAAGRQAAPKSATPASGGTSSVCDGHRGDNIKVNQNCLNITDVDLNGRGQSQNETWVSVNPNNTRQIIASYNDYRRGDGTCGVTFSADGGKTWADATTPNGFVRGTAFGGTAREYFQAAGDTAVEWDTRGNAYLLCQEFKRGVAVTADTDQSSAFYIHRSTGNGGASFNFPGRPVAEHADLAGAGDFLLDKPLMTVDNHVRSPFRDRVYVTWTTFAEDGTGYIFASSSADYGEHFSDPVLVSSDSALCPNAGGVPTPRGRCNNNQFSQPVVAPDGTLHVVWANYNTANAGADNRFQMLAVRSTDGGATFSAPVKVGDFYDLPDCDTYQGAGKNPGRACVVEKGSTTNSIFRAANLPYAAVDPGNPRKIAVAYGSYINRNSNETKGCTPAGFTPGLGSLYTGVKDGGCNNDIVLSTSANGGTSFTGTATDVRAMAVASSAARQAGTDQFWQGLSYSPRGTLVVAYYDRQYGADNTTGFSDITLSTSRGGPFKHVRVTSSSMPPTTQFNGQFMGDYIQVDTTATKAYPVWVDTRADALFLCPGTGQAGAPPRLCTAPPPGPQTLRTANDQEIFTAAVPIG
ncbi:MAG TPA: sialidase family protein [Streptosporangiaceae bacterium]|nr:sialidase family protein [Streptosporangiaceae bacterium]